MNKPTGEKLQPLQCGDSERAANHLRSCDKCAKKILANIEAEKKKEIKNKKEKKRKEYMAGILYEWSIINRY